MESPENIRITDITKTDRLTDSLNSVMFSVQLSLDKLGGFFCSLEVETSLGIYEF